MTLLPLRSFGMVKTSNPTIDHIDFILKSVLGTSDSFCLITSHYESFPSNHHLDEEAVLLVLLSPSFLSNIEHNNSLWLPPFLNRRIIKEGLFGVGRPSSGLSGLLAHGESQVSSRHITVNKQENKVFLFIQLDYDGEISQRRLVWCRQTIFRPQWAAGTWGITCIIQTYYCKETKKKVTSI